MSNDRVERDDFIHALGQTLKFYNKDLEEFEASFWWTTVKDIPVKSLKLALVEHVKRGKFAPKPADLIAILSERGSRRAERVLPPPDTDPSREATELDKAWVYCIKLFCKDATGIIGKQYGDLERLDADTEDRYLHMVNHHARETGSAEAIPDEFKLREVWG